MSNLLIQKIDEKNINSTAKIAGQILVTSSTVYRKIYYDNSNTNRKEITSSCKVYSDYNAITEAYNAIIMNKIYLDLSTLKIYGIIKDQFVEITNTTDLETIINNVDAYRAGVLYKDGKLSAVISTENQILTSTGETLSNSIDPSKLLTVVRVSFVYMTIKADNTKTVYIPFPKENFDFANGDTMYVVKDSIEFSNSKYFINGNYMVLNEGVTPFAKDEMITLIFYYKVNYDLNSLVKLGTQNIADGSITTEKISPYFQLSADRVDETGERIFFTSEEKEKLKGIEDHATHYVQPETFPATMIKETDDKMFITKAILQKLLTTDNGYTKTQIDKMFSDIIGGAPDLLNTLYELAQSLNNDANFAANITKLINQKADATALDALSKVVDTKVSNNDYIRGCVYSTPAKTTITGEGELYSVTISDSSFLQYVDGMKVVMKLKDTDGNTTNAFIRINSLVKKPILLEGLPLLEGEMLGGGIYEFRFNGSKDSFQLQGKGGVKILNTSLNKYKLATGESITKGQLMDKLPDNTICAVRPHLKMTSLNESEDVKFYCNGQVGTVNIDKDSALVLWKWDNSLRAKVINLKDIYIDIDSTNYVEISNNCSSFSLTKVGDSDYIVSYSGIDKTVNVKHMKIGSESSITIVADSYITSETDNITQIYSIPINTNKVLVIWQVGTNTKCTFFIISSNIMSSLSTRNNTGYFINKMCKISDSQILFGTVINKSIQLWVMNVSGADFSFCDIVSDFYIDSLDNLSNLVITRLSNTTAYLSWTNSQASSYYYTTITISNNGGIDKGPVLSKAITPTNFQSYMIYKHLEVQKDYFLSVSNYNQQIPTTIAAPGKKCIKLLISRKGNPFDQIDIFSNIYNSPSNYDFDILGDNRIFVVYSDKQSNGDIYHLYFMVCDIIHTPFGVALQSGVAGDMISVKEW